MTTLTLAEATLFAGRYRVVRCIAHGGMGAVYEVVHLETERRRALKVMLPHLVQSEDLRERFRREARVAAQIDSAFIVDVFDAGIDEATGMPFLVMELLRGEELGKRLERVGRFGLEEAVGYLWQTALALDKTHKASIVHRDLKPENLFLSEQDDGPPRIKVLDFGIAKFVSEGGTHANATRSIGTPLYMAPEQFKSGSTVSALTDNYALGMMAYTLLVGAPYWSEEQKAGSNVFEFAASVMQGPQEAATARASRKGVKLPDAFDGWFRQATSRHPNERFFTATAAIVGLAQALGVPAPGQAAQAAQSAASTGPQGEWSSGPTAPARTALASSGPQGGTVLLAESTPGMASSGPLGLEGRPPNKGIGGLAIGIAAVAVIGIGTAAFVATRGGDNGVRPEAATAALAARGATEKGAEPTAPVEPIGATAATKPQVEPVVAPTAEPEPIPTANAAVIVPAATQKVAPVLTGKLKPAPTAKPVGKSAPSDYARD